MKNRRLNKILASCVLSGMVLAAPFTFAGCSSDSDVNVRVYDGYVQWQEEGDSSWNNVLTIEEVKDILGDTCDCNTVINGKLVEFRTYNGYIQWRYQNAEQGESANWENLVEVPKSETDVDEINKRGYNLFTSDLDSMNSDIYDVKYNYSDGRYYVESFIDNFAGGVYGASQGTFNAKVLIQYDFGTFIGGGDSSVEEFQPYVLNLIPYIKDSKTPKQTVVASCKFNREKMKYEFVTLSGSLYFNTNVANKIEDFDHVEFFKGFKLENVLDCQFNENGDCRILFDYYTESWSSDRPYRHYDYLYEFNVTKDGYISECYVYEKDFLDPTKKGDLFCDIVYENDWDECVIKESEIFTEVFEAYIEEHPTYKSWDDIFGY